MENLMLPQFEDVTTIVFGVIALIVYWLQQRKKMSEAAALVLLQVRDIQYRIQEISTYIVDGKLDDRGFYESQLLYDEPYWNKYKHYFIRVMDVESLQTFDNFYRCASEIMEQQQFMKFLQKNHLLLTQQTLMQMEANMFSQKFDFNQQTQGDLFKSLGEVKDDIYKTGLTQYVPLQIRISLENALKKYSYIQIHSSDGYRQIKEIAKRKL